MEYLLGGVSWRPTYDMWVGADTDETVELDYFAEISDSALELDDVDTQLVAGMVDLNRPIAPAAELSMNQKLAGFEMADSLAVSAPVGQVDIQHTYDIGKLTAEPGDTIYSQLVGQELPARRLHIWNAPTDEQVTVIYKVKNESDQPFSEGVVRNYQDGLFIGSDFIELTPVGGEGSVTIGHLQDVRVKREQTQTAVDMGRFDYQYEVTLTIENFTPTTVHMDVVDFLRTARRGDGGLDQAAARAGQPHALADQRRARRRDGHQLRVPRGLRSGPTRPPRRHHGRLRQHRPAGDVIGVTRQDGRERAPRGLRHDDRIDRVGQPGPAEQDSQHASRYRAIVVGTNGSTALSVRSIDARSRPPRCTCATTGVGTIDFIASLPRTRDGARAAVACARARSGRRHRGRRFGLEAPLVTRAIRGTRPRRWTSSGIGPNSSVSSRSNCSQSLALALAPSASLR